MGAPVPMCPTRFAPNDPGRTSGSGTVRGEVWDFGHIRGILSNCRINRQTVLLSVIWETCNYKVGALAVSSLSKAAKRTGQIVRYLNGIYRVPPDTRSFSRLAI
jgi:hypothetical protein